MKTSVFWAKLYLFLNIVAFEGDTLGIAIFQNFDAFSVIRNGLKMSYDSNTIQELQDKRAADKKKELERGVDPFLMKMCIIGGRYDEFKVFEICIIHVHTHIRVRARVKIAREDTLFFCIIQNKKMLQF